MEIGFGLLQEIVVVLITIGTGVTVIILVVEVELYLTELLGVKVTERVWPPIPSLLPKIGVYLKVPGTFALALNCVFVSSVP